MKSLKSIEKALSHKPYVPSSEDPREELRKLVRQHKALTKASVANHHMGSDRKNLETGEVIACRLPEDAMVELQGISESLTKKASKLEGAMLRELKKVPIYQAFLANVFGVGPVVAAYLVAEIDIHRAVKPSNLRRFCGLAVVNGRLERPTSGQKNAYSKEMRTRLFQAFAAMWKNAAKCGVSTKYLDVWKNYKHRMWSSERVYDVKQAKDGPTGKILVGEKAVSARGHIHSTGWHKAADVLVEDLYIVWRALERLPVWPSYYAAKLGYEHGGKISVNAPQMLSVEEALEMVGDVGGIAAVAAE